MVLSPGQGSMADLALFFHLLGAMLFAAGIAVAGAAFESARRREQPAEMAALLLLARVGVALVGIGALLVLSFGLWLVHLRHLSYSTGWVAAAIALYLMALALGAFGGQKPKQARLLASDLAARGAPANDQLHAELNDRLSRSANYGSAVLVLAILVVMVFKP
jgi:uncharacterized membrane protein